MPHFDDLPESATTDATLPETVLVLKVPGTFPEELVVQQEDFDDRVFCFESLDDAMECAILAEEALGFAPRIGRIRSAELTFRTARFKPAVGSAFNLPLPGGQP
ncbi:MAG: hypothetical protein ACKO5K_03780 [Armatimonadota bacterium]